MPNNLISTTKVVEAMCCRWDAVNLDARFIAKRAGLNTAPVLHDTKAQPGTPFPYCVFRQGVGRKVVGMAAGAVRVAHFTFTVYGRHTEEQTAKEMAAELIDEIISAYEGDKLVLAGQACIMNIEWVDDFSSLDEEEEQWWSWICAVMYDAETSS